MKTLLSRFVTEEHGQDLIEYALLAGFISLAAVAAITSISTELAGLYGDTEQALKDANKLR
jgi:pilus assembly protein Flp/PilA